jgi:hypothetical protein
MLNQIIRKNKTLLALAGLAAMAVTLIHAPLVSAASFSATWGYATNVEYHYTDYTNSAFYIGQLRDTATPNGYCVEMQRKTSTGAWVRTGFYNSNTHQPYTYAASACTTSYIYWYIPASTSATTTGLRMVDGSGRYLTFCSTTSTCRALHL